MRTSFKSKLELVRHYADEENCKKLLENRRWPNGVICIHCGHEKVYQTNRGYKCAKKDCGKKFSVLTGSIFENTKIPLNVWFEAIFVISAHKKGISSHQLARDIDVTQKTAWFVLHRIREMLKEKKPIMLTGTVSGDETFIGGSLRNKHKKVRYENVERRGRAFKNKTMVAGLLEKDGKVANRVIETTSTKNLKGFMVDHVAPGAIIVTDTRGPAYIRAARGYRHVVVDHTKDQYVKDGFSTNGLEGYWSLLKRGIIGIYHQVSPGHLSRYCDEFSFRYNTRKSTDVERFISILERCSGRLKYDILISKK